MSKQKADEQLAKVRALLPEGKVVTYASIKKELGNDLARALSFVQPKTIIRRGDHYEVESEKSGAVKNDGTTLTLHEQVIFDLKASETAFLISGIKGVSISVLSFNMLSLHELVVTPNADETITVEGKALISRFLPYYSFTRQFLFINSP